MFILNKDIETLVVLMHEKNELSSRRKKLRAKERRFKRTLSCQSHINAIETAKVAIRRREKLLAKSQQLEAQGDIPLPSYVEKDKLGMYLINHHNTMIENIKYYEDNLKDLLECLDQKLEGVSQKQIGRPFADVRLDLLNVKLEYAQVQLEIAEFTKKNRKNMSAICRTYNLHRTTDGVDNRYRYLHDKDDNTINRKEMERISYDYKLRIAFDLEEDTLD